MNNISSLSDAFETSLETVIASGYVDPQAQAALIAAARKLAQSIDADCERSANVKFPVMLKYMDALGMLPTDEKKDAKPPASKLDNLIKNSRFAREANIDS